MKKDSALRIVVRLLPAVLAAVFVFSMTKIILYHEEDGKASEFYRSICDLSQPADESSGEVEEGIDFESLKALNPDVIGWIRLEGTVLDYPIVQGRDNRQYLRHLIDGSYNKAGTLFADYRNVSPFSDTNTVIYGHNNRSGLMFAVIAKYRDPDFYQKHPVIELYTPEGKWLLQPVSLTVEDGIFDFVRFDLTGDQLVEYIDDHKKESLLESDQQVGSHDLIVSLVTCCYDRKNARYLLICRMQKEK